MQYYLKLFNICVPKDFQKPEFNSSIIFLVQNLFEMSGVTKDFELFESISNLFLSISKDGNEMRKLIEVVYYYLIILLIFSNLIGICQ